LAQSRLQSGSGAGSVPGMSGTACTQTVEALDLFALPRSVSDEDVMFGGRLEALLPEYETLPAAVLSPRHAPGRARGGLPYSGSP